MYDYCKFAIYNHREIETKFEYVIARTFVRVLMQLIS
jgi:hypothetical protein